MKEFVEDAILFIALGHKSSQVKLFPPYNCPKMH